MQKHAKKELSVQKMVTGVWFPLTTLFTDWFFQNYSCNAARVVTLMSPKPECEGSIFLNREKAVTTLFFLKNASWDGFVGQNEVLRNFMFDELILCSAVTCLSVTQQNF